MYISHVARTSSGQMMQSRPVSTIAQLDRWEVYCVEVHIIFTHELEQTDVLRIEPPLFPFGSVVGRNAHISNWCIELKTTLISSTSERNIKEKALTHTSVLRTLSVRSQRILRS